MNNRVVELGIVKIADKDFVTHMIQKDLISNL